MVGAGGSPCEPGLQSADTTFSTKLPTLNGVVLRVKNPCLRPLVKFDILTATSVGVSHVSRLVLYYNHVM